MNLITTVSGNQLDLDETQGQYEYVGKFLNEHAAGTDVWMCLSRLNARIAELETQWHPASEPPEEEKDVLVRAYDGDMWRYKYEGVFFTGKPVTHWRDLPPMPERSDQ